MCVRDKSACVVPNRRVENPGPSRVYSRFGQFFLFEYSGESAYNTSYLHRTYEQGVSCNQYTEDELTTLALRSTTVEPGQITYSRVLTSFPVPTT